MYHNATREIHDPAILRERQFGHHSNLIISGASDKSNMALLILVSHLTRLRGHLMLPERLFRFCAIDGPYHFCYFCSKMVTFRIHIAAVLLLVLNCTHTSAADMDEDFTSAEVATQIRSTFDSRQAELQPETRYHYALRMYRVTGDSTYIPQIIEVIPSIRQQLRDDLDSLSDSTYVSRRREMLLQELGEGNRKSRARSELFRSRGNLIVDLTILTNCYRVADHTAQRSEDDSLIERAKQYLKSVNFTSLTSDQRMVVDYSAQAANAIYYLYFLGIADFRADYLNHFRHVFPDAADNRLSNLEFGDKIYGLTHLIIASSRYYQQTVDTTEVNWILRYFESRRKRILNSTKPDIVAEVGICFLLAGDFTSPLVDACRRRVSGEFSATEKMIPSTSGTIDIESGEHRNVLAYILLAWPSQLYSGPVLLTNPPSFDN